MSASSGTDGHWSTQLSGSRPVASDDLTDDDVGVTVFPTLGDDLVRKLLEVRQRLDRLRGVLDDAGQLRQGPLLTCNRPQDHCPLFEVIPKQL
ncbi:hypothetical protein AB0L63_04090 [Nocardia sp. NPDC051990]|uniref:hypothetical protein n=1 Tax=Nocardia sp. NPDC051990 TaxID=3155285 RepID=UPI00342ACA61